ncbi:hypothetical protein BaRGS_00012330 [Batillaria attramentaria]|uniref:Uncharacterized protein n=1 Tax=Batillaria attramentaria TaxID=370345 RepID=A0ABD0LAY3_9CAEN
MRKIRGSVNSSFCAIKRNGPKLTEPFGISEIKYSQGTKRDYKNMIHFHETHFSISISWYKHAQVHIYTSELQQHLECSRHSLLTSTVNSLLKFKLTADIHCEYTVDIHCKLTVNIHSDEQSPWNAQNVHFAYQTHGADTKAKRPRAMMQMCWMLNSESICTNKQQNEKEQRMKNFCPTVHLLERGRGEVGQTDITYDYTNHETVTS